MSIRDTERKAMGLSVPVVRVLADNDAFGLIGGTKLEGGENLVRRRVQSVVLGVVR